jgi:hypothetical protein
MSEPDAVIPKFRVHVAISRKNAEILVTPLSKFPLSPYPESDAGYGWNEFEPVSVMPFAGSPERLGELVKAAIQISQLHYRAPEADGLLKQREERRKYLVEKFGKGNPRFRHPPSFSFVASTAADYDVYMKEYDHILVEDGGASILRLFPESNLHSIHRQISYDSRNKVLGQMILDMGRSSEVKYEHTGS